VAACRCWRRDGERLERKHRCRDLTRDRIGDRGRGSFEHEQPRTGDLARKCFAVADWEERVCGICLRRPSKRQ
jgi:hypothetical protein